MWPAEPRAHPQSLSLERLLWIPQGLMRLKSSFVICLVAGTIFLLGAHDTETWTEDGGQVLQSDGRRPQEYVYMRTVKTHHFRGNNRSIFYFQEKMQQNLSLPLSVKARKNMLGNTPELFLLPLLEIIQVKMIQKSLDQQKCCLIGQTLSRIVTPFWVLTALFRSEFVWN